MKKLIVYTLLVFSLLFFTPGRALAAADKLTVYTSMKESLIGELKDAFVKANPDIKFDYYSAGAGKLMAKVAAERESGQLVVDVLWHSEVPDFYQLKKEGVLEPYISPQAKYVESPVSEPQGYFTPVRNGTLAITYNTRFIKTPPKEWKDLLRPEYKGAFGVANPALSGTAFGSVVALAQTFGWEYFENARKNEARMGQGSGQVVDDTAMGDLLACIGVDYITTDKIQKGATLGFVYPKEIIMLPSPVAIMKGTKNLGAAKKFVDFLLSVEAQTIIAANGTLPVRSDVRLPAGTLLPDPHDAVKRAIKIDFEKLSDSKEATIKKFTDIMRPSK